jgi:hypothetical protein
MSAQLTKAATALLITDLRTLRQDESASVAVKGAGVGVNEKGQLHQAGPIKISSKEI